MLHHPRLGHPTSEAMKAIRLKCIEFEKGLDSHHVEMTISNVFEGFHLLATRNPQWVQQVKAGSIRKGRSPVEVFLGDFSRLINVREQSYTHYGFKPVRFCHEDSRKYLNEVWEAVIEHHLPKPVDNTQQLTPVAVA